MHIRPSAGPAAAAALCAAWLVSTLPAAAVAEQGYRLKPLKEAPPKDVSKELRAVLGKQGFRIAGPDGKPFVDGWLVKHIVTREDEKELGINFGQVREGTLLGVLRFARAGKDFRGNRFKAGTFTFRYTLQPEDGDHLGASESRDFALLCPAKEDAKPAPLAPEKVVKLSVKVSGRKHPCTLHLMKMVGESKKLPRVFERQDLEYWLLDCQIPDKETKKKPVRLGLVLVGQAEEF
ncbi:MAG: hypothetical protein O7J95_13865 [Planctomycetota bacterium]|nr:hypothetical protein [Planctomycetota bacterium]